MNDFIKSWQKVLTWLVNLALIGNIGGIIWLFIDNSRAMRADPDTQSNLGWFLLAYLVILGILIGYWAILFLVKKIPDDNKWKSVALTFFTLLFIGPICWLFL